MTANPLRCNDLLADHGLHNEAKHSITRIMLNLLENIIHKLVSRKLRQDVRDTYAAGDAFGSCNFTGCVVTTNDKNTMLTAAF